VLINLEKNNIVRTPHTCRLKVFNRVSGLRPPFLSTETTTPSIGSGGRAIIHIGGWEQDEFGDQGMRSVSLRAGGESYLGSSSEQNYEELPSLTATCSRCISSWQTLNFVRKVVRSCICYTHTIAAFEMSGFCDVGRHDDSANGR